MRWSIDQTDVRDVPSILHRTAIPKGPDDTTSIVMQSAVFAIASKEISWGRSVLLDVYRVHPLSGTYPSCTLSLFMHRLHIVSTCPLVPTALASFVFMYKKRELSSERGCGSSHETTGCWEADTFLARIFLVASFLSSLNKSESDQVPTCFRKKNQY